MVYPSLEEIKLDNPVAFSLEETHQSLRCKHKGMPFYLPKYCPFGASNPLSAEGINSYAKGVAQFYVVGDKPRYDDTVVLEKDLVCAQMLLSQTIDVSITETIIPLSTSQHKRDLYQLVQRIQPGYFQRNTVAMGNYYGIYRGDSLVAACGERMKMNAFTELSAIVTHPQYRRLGLASQLIKRATDTVFDENKRPYLHVLTSNKEAIGVYKTLGFKTRRTIHFWKFAQASL